MTDQQQHPITPSPELIEEWIELSRPQKDRSPNPNVLATYAARWGSDQELEACCEWLDDFLWVVQPNHQVHPMVPKGAQLRKHRRPKPPSLKEQALALLDPSNTYGSITQEEEYRISVANADTIRRALEALPDD